MAFRQTWKVLCVLACECRLDARDHDFEQVGCVTRHGWPLRNWLVFDRQAVAVEDGGRDLGDVVEAGGEVGAWGWGNSRYRNTEWGRWTSQGSKWKKPLDEAPRFRVVLAEVYWPSRTRHPSGDSSFVWPG
jgi:hypothetical protein